MLTDRLRAFACGHGRADWTFVLRDYHGPIAGRLTGRVRRYDEMLVVEGAESFGFLDPGNRRAEILADPMLMSLDGLLRAALQIDVLSRGGFLVHSAALVVQGRAHLFPGRSGSGKTTLASLAGDPLCDEFCAVLPCHEGWEVHGTPWWKGRAGAAPLAGAYVLGWEGEGITPLPRAGVLRHLASNLVLPVDGSVERATAFAAVGRLAATIPFARFDFRRTSDVDALLGSAERGEAA